MSTSTSAKIQYADADGSANTIRLTSQTFNNGRILDYGYNTGLDADISRVSYIADDGGTSAGVHLENYSYLGLDTVVKRGHPETGVDQTLIGSGTGDGGDQYVGLDRFGRVILQNWTIGTTSSDEYEYAYDRNGNALYQKNDLSSVNSELYHANSSTSGDNNSAYDTLNRLTGFRRGTLSSSSNNGSGLDTVSTLSTVFSNNQETWSLDSLGNWSSQTVDGTATSRTHNKKNQATAVGTSSLTFDNDGNTTTDDQGQTFKYDAWNHIIQVKDNTSTTIVTYSYDANQRRITAVSPGTATRDLYFDTDWRIIEEYSNGTLNDQNIFTVNGYIDDVVLVDHDATTGGSYGKTSSGLDQRLYEMQDGQHRSTGLVNTSGSVVERFQYDPYGNLTDMNASWGTATTGYAWEFLWKGMRLQTRDDIYYVRHRDYSPTLGRFLQEDPAGYIDGANLYQGLRDNPERYTDPSGMFPPGGGGDSEDAAELAAALAIIKVYNPMDQLTYGQGTETSPFKSIRDAINAVNARIAGRQQSSQDNAMTVAALLWPYYKFTCSISHTIKVQAGTGVFGGIIHDKRLIGFSVRRGRREDLGAAEGISSGLWGATNVLKGFRYDRIFETVTPYTFTTTFYTVCTGTRQTVNGPQTVVSKYSWNFNDTLWVVTSTVNDHANELIRIKSAELEHAEVEELDL